MSATLAVPIERPARIQLAIGTVWVICREIALMEPDEIPALLRLILKAPLRCGRGAAK